jgi:hypothetical protein
MKSLEGLRVYGELADARWGVYVADLARTKRRKRKFPKTSAKRAPRKAVTR